MNAAPLDPTRLGTNASGGCAPQGRRYSWVVAWSFFFIVVLAFPFDCSAARWYEDYEKAVDLIGDGECSREALQLLGAAVVDKKKPRLNARTIAVKTVDYLPYYQLARAHLACGEADSARHYIEESRSRGVAPSNQLDDLERQVSEIEASTHVAVEPEIDLEELTSLAGEATETIRQAISASERVNSRRGTDWLAGFFAENQDALNKANGDLTRAQGALNEGTLKQDRAAIQNAEAFASRALVVYTGLESEMVALQPPKPTPQLVVALPAATPTASPIPTRAVVVSRPRPTPVPTRSSSSGPESRPREIPESIRRAAADYLTAGYDEVIRELEPSEYSTVEQQAAAYLLRAAAHFAIYCLEGREDEDRLEQVHWDLSLLNRLDPSLRPDPLIFSPEFVELIDNFD